MNKIIALGALLLIGSNSIAQSSNEIYRLFPVLECPAVGDEFEKMISRLDSIKTSIREGANCKNILLEVRTLEQLVTKDRQAVLELVNGAKDQALTAEQAQLVSKYAEAVTTKVAALSDLFMNSNQCFSEDTQDQRLTSLAGFVSEASQLVGAVTGPWGAPIALAGNIVAGFMTGLDRIFKSRAGFDFNKPDQWMSYVQHLCTYHSYRDQIDHLLNPQSRISQLEGLKTTLSTQIRTMTDTCSECRTIQTAYESQKALGSVEVSSLLNPTVQAADSRFGKPYGTYMLQNLGLRDWVIGEITRIKQEADSYWGDVSGRYLLYDAKQSIEEFLLVKEAPRFLDFQAQRSRQDFSEFAYFAMDNGRELYDALERANNRVINLKVERGNRSDPIGYFRALVLQPIKLDLLAPGDAADDMKYSWLYYRDQGLVHLRTAQTSAQVMQSFCLFFKHAGQFSPGIRENCSSEMFRQLITTENRIESEVANSPVLVEGGKPMTINLDLGSNVDYSNSKIESLSRGIKSRSL